MCIYMRIYICIYIYRVQKSARYHDRLIGHLVRMGAMDWLKGTFKSKPPIFRIGAWFPVTICPFFDPSVDGRFFGYIYGILIFSIDIPSFWDDDSQIDQQQAQHHQGPLPFHQSSDAAMSQPCSGGEIFSERNCCNAT